MPGTLDLIWIILVLGLVFYLAWIVTRFVAVRARGKASGRVMRVVDRLNVGNDKAILLIKVGGEYCVIGVTGHEMRLIKTLGAEEAESLADEDPQPKAWPDGQTAGIFKGIQTFSERLGFAIRRPASRPAAKPVERQDPPGPDGDGPSAIDRMNERIRLRKETRRR